MSGLEITIAKQLGSMIARQFGPKVIERWTQYRAEKFFEEFVESLADELARRRLRPTSNWIEITSLISQPRFLRLAQGPRWKTRD